MGEKECCEKVGQAFRDAVKCTRRSRRTVGLHNPSTSRGGQQALPEKDPASLQSQPDDSKPIPKGSGMAQSDFHGLYGTPSREAAMMEFSKLMMDCLKGRPSAPTKEVGDCSISYTPSRNYVDASGCRSHGVTTAQFFLQQSSQTPVQCPVEPGSVPGLLTAFEAFQQPQGRQADGLLDWSVGQAGTEVGGYSTRERRRSIINRHLPLSHLLPVADPPPSDHGVMGVGNLPSNHGVTTGGNNNDDAYSYPTSFWSWDLEPNPISYHATSA
jgi:hypothetical protein